MTGKLLTIRQAADRLNISEKLMRRLVWANEIGYIDINKGGRHIMARFTEGHIEEFLRERSPSGIKGEGLWWR